MAKRSAQGFAGWLPLKENFANTPKVVPNVEFSVPQRLPQKLKKKLNSVRPKPVSAKSVPPKYVHLKFLPPKYVPTHSLKENLANIPNVEFSVPQRLPLKIYAAIKVQEIFRANQLMKSERKRYLVVRQSALLIQRCFRARKQMLEERTRFQELRTAVITTQRLVRANQLMKVERQKFLQTKNSILLIQRCLRARKQMLEERTRFQELRTAVITTQRLVRANQLMKVERQKFLQTKNSILLIQRRFRLKKVVPTAEIAAIRIQSLWRGYTTRKRIHEVNQKVKTAMERIRTSTSMVTEDRILCNRTNNSLNKLLKYTSLLALSHELDDLDGTTRLSPESCETIATAGAVPILLKILNESNRSEPHKQIIILLINILINLAKFDKTLPELMSEPNESSTVDIIFKMMRAFVRNDQLIDKCLTLLWILLKDESLRRRVMSDKRKVETITQILDLSKKDKSYKKYKLKSEYSFAPKWQIAKTNVFEFTNHFVAIQAIANRLELK